jgi:hypothetical protein
MTDTAASARSSGTWSLPKRPLDLAVALIGGGIFIGVSIVSIISTAVFFKTPFFDWTFYAGAVNRWLSGDQIYPGSRISTLGSPAGSSYAYPPASVPLMLPFASWPLGAIAWEVVIVGAFLLGIWSVVRVGWPGRPLLALGIALAVAANVGGVMEGIAVANVNIATAGAIGLIWAGTRGAEPFVGVLAIMKVFPFALSAPGGWQALRRSAALVGVICLITLPLVGVSAWADYWTGLEASRPLCGDPLWTNYSLACQLTPHMSAFAAKWIGVVIAFVLVLFAIKAGMSFLGMSAATFAIIVPADELHAHYVAMVVMLALIGLADLNLRRTSVTAMTLR